MTHPRRAVRDPGFLSCDETTRVILKAVRPSFQLAVLAD
jgi:hypothetical protein